MKTKYYVYNYFVDINIKSIKYSTKSIFSIICKDLYYSIK
ncbi:17955_t:CDS:2 [Cetraspora pellucida]|uniref:17955_t:CDS:1 n=1 Tax=Cetraspora pellucida TaxID=1433469 RepID=A0A9N8ZRX0_9GLOM|nr:17955_t:CDS:2 [Cetraspora pellucida]